MATSPRAWHRHEAENFADLIDLVVDWDAPTPVVEWAAVDVVAHILVWWPSVLGYGGLVLPTPDPNDLAGSFWRQSVAIDELLADEKLLITEFVGPDGPLGTVADAFGFYTADLFMHSWDLARSAGRAITLRPDTAELLLAGMVGVADELRARGDYGPPVAVSPDAPAGDRLLGFIGRDPGWRPPGTGGVGDE